MIWSSISHTKKKCKIHPPPRKEAYYSLTSPSLTNHGILAVDKNQTVYKGWRFSPRILKCLGFLRKMWYPHTVATALLRNRSGSLGNHLEAINSPSYLPRGKFWNMSYGLSVLTEYVGQQVLEGRTGSQGEGGTGRGKGYQRGW